MSINNEMLAYIRCADTSYEWERLSTRRVAEGVLQDLRLVSQTWQGIRWTHRLHLFLPDRPASPEWALLTVGADAPPQDGVTHLDLELARQTGMVSAHLYDVPNQPLFNGLREDELLAHTLTQYLDEGDPTWPLLFPMVKAALRGLDTIEEVCRNAKLQTPMHFAIHGASKRGWTSWLTAVADPRVKAILPEVYDNLNLFAQMPHQVKVWDAYSEMIDDYTEQRLQDKMRTPRGRQMTLVVDPYTYRESLTLPKLLIHGASDRYWATDAVNLYWDDLAGRKYLIVAPNEGHHILDRARIRPTQAAFLRGIAAGRPLPELTWAFDETDAALQITLRTDTSAQEARLWKASSDSQDFRDSRWEPASMTAGADGQSFTGTVLRPEAGYVAVVAECLFPHENQPFLLSTQVRVLGSSRD